MIVERLENVPLPGRTPAPPRVRTSNRSPRIVAAALVAACIVAAAAAQGAARPHWHGGDAILPSLGVSDLGVARQRSWVAGTGRPDCGGPCVIDLAFVYGDDLLAVYDRLEACGSRTGLAGVEFPRVRSIEELRALLRKETRLVNEIWQENGLNAELRFAGAAHLPALDGSRWSYPNQPTVNVRRVRERFGADIVYALTHANLADDCGFRWGGGFARVSVVPDIDGLTWKDLPRPKEDAYRVLDDSTEDGYLSLPTAFHNGTGGVLAHELGHNFGLSHDPALRARLGEGPPLWQGGQGYSGEVITIMAGGIDDDQLLLQRYSTSKATYTTGVRTYSLGEKEVHESMDVLRWNIPRLAAARSLDPKPGPCADDALCFHDGRFEVRVTWSAPDGRSGRGDPLPLDGLAGGLFSFFDPTNPEMLVKILDGCGVNRHWWVYVAAATDVAFEVAVRRTYTGERKVYRHYGGELARALGDNAAFPCQ